MYKCARKYRLEHEKKKHKNWHHWRSEALFINHYGDSKITSKINVSKYVKEKCGKFYEDVKNLLIIDE